MEEIMDSEKFRQDCYNVFDDRARVAVRNWVDSQGLFSLSVEDYGADLKVARIVDGKAVITRHELEIRTPWKSNEIFPYETITIPHRKEKLFGIGVDDLFFWSISGDCKMGMYVCASIVSKCTVIEKLTTRGMGKFFVVPRKCYAVVDLTIK